MKNLGNLNEVISIPESSEIVLFRSIRPGVDTKQLNDNLSKRLKNTELKIFYPGKVK